MVEISAFLNEKAPLFQASFVRIQADFFSLGFGVSMSSEMNDIELNAMVALEHLADTILFIFDASETCGFSLESQYNLLKQIEQVFSEIPIIYLFNKMDIVKDVEDQEYIKPYVDEFDDAIFISAIDGEGIEKISKKFDTIKKIERESEDDFY